MPKNAELRLSTIPNNDQLLFSQDLLSDELAQYFANDEVVIAVNNAGNVIEYDVYCGTWKNSSGDMVMVRKSDSIDSADPKDWLVLYFHARTQTVHHPEVKIANTIKRSSGDFIHLMMGSDSDNNLRGYGEIIEFYVDQDYLSTSSVTILDNGDRYVFE